MAMIDYGAIAFKNGEIINEKDEYFTPMELTCGFSDEGEALPEAEHCFSHNYFITLGDRDFLIGFYKNYMTYWCDYHFDEEDCVSSYCYHSENFAFTPYRKWRKWEDYVNGVSITVKPRNGYYVCRFTYKGDNYKVYFGHGVDLSWYKKTGFVNIYRTKPSYVWNNIKYYLSNRDLSFYFRVKIAKVKRLFRV